MQTVLGAGGAIGEVLAGALRQYTDEVRLVSRNPKAVTPGDQLLAADLTHADAVLGAVDGSEIVYLTVGLPYNTRTWQTTWPVVMENVINACRTHGARLVFFDNIYAYDPEFLSRMTEETPIGPVSRKGEVREQILRMLFDAVNRGDIQALVARAADFYGPSIRNNSMLTETVFENLHKGKKAYWLGSDAWKHAFTYTPDAGRGTTLLGNTPDAYNQVWHLPTAPDPFTGREWVTAIAREMGVEPKIQRVPKFMARAMGIFVPIMGELVEMMYQYERDYIFDSSKFEKRFDVRPTPYLEGIRQIIQTDYRK